jgi:hypothetical protein
LDKPKKRLKRPYFRSDNERVKGMSREIDERVAECLGWDIYNESYDGWYVWRKSDGSTVVDKLAEPFTFFSGDGMLLLIEEARKQGIYLDPSHHPEGWRVNALKLDGDGIMSLLVTPLPVIIKSFPLATALSFLKAKGVDIKPYLEGVNAG